MTRRPGRFRPWESAGREGQAVAANRRMQSVSGRLTRRQQGTQYRVKWTLKPGPHYQQCRSNVRLCRKDEISTQKLVRHCCRFWQQSRTLLRHCCWCGPGFTERVVEALERLYEFSFTCLLYTDTFCKRTTKLSEQSQSHGSIRCVFNHGKVDLLPSGK